MDFVESVFKKLNKETKSKLVSLALRDGKEKFVKKHKGELKGVQKKYLEAKDIKEKTNKELDSIKETLYKEYKEGKLVELEIDMMKKDLEIRDSIISKIYEEGDIQFIQKYIKSISSRLKNKILLEEYQKGNIDFVYKNFDIIDNGGLKQNILNKQLQEKNFKFLYENYKYIFNIELKEKIIRKAYEEEKIDFLNEHIEDIPKNLKLEAAVRFKDFKISKEELAMLLRK